MNSLIVFIYFVCFAIIAGGAFAMMWSNIRSIHKDMDRPIKRHPEAPKPGDELLYVDLTRQRLEKLIDD